MDELFNPKENLDNEACKIFHGKKEGHFIMLVYLLKSWLTWEKDHAYVIEVYTKEKCSHYRVYQSWQHAYTLRTWLDGKWTASNLSSLSHHTDPVIFRDIHFENASAFLSHHKIFQKKYGNKQVLSYKEILKATSREDKVLNLSIDKERPMLVAIAAPVHIPSKKEKTIRFVQNHPKIIAFFKHCAACCNMARSSIHNS